MNKSQKNALFIIAVSVTTLILAIFVALEFFTPKDYTPFVYTTLIILIPITFLTPLIIAVIERKNKIKHDERDRTIKLKAAAFTFITLWVLIAIGNYLALLLIGESATVRIELLPIFSVILLILTLLIYGLSITYQYARGGAKNE